MAKETKKIKRDKKGRFVKGTITPSRKGHISNPTGKGGFTDHPENISSGYWNSEDSISFQYKKLIRMTAHQFEWWRNSHPKKKRTVAQEIAYQAVRMARIDLPYLKEVTDRTEGKAAQSMDLTSGGESLNRFNDDQINKIAKRLARRKAGDDNTSK